MNQVYELIIIGAGPAGMAAAIYAKRAEIDSIVIEKEPISGGQVVNTYEIDNYPGLPGISGMDLANKFREHCEQLGVKFEIGEVVNLTVEADKKVLTLEDGTVYYAKTIIVATGAQPRMLKVKGEMELAGMGVSYCATCDGAFFKDRAVAVVGGGDVAVEDAIFLSRICKKVYVIHRRNEFRAAKSLVVKLQEQENIEVIWNATVEEICGDDMVESVKIIQKQIGKLDTLAVDGVFIAIGYEPKTETFKGILDMDEAGYIRADETLITSVPGVFVAGDVRMKRMKQIVVAVSDGANAVASVERYLISN